VKRTPVLLAAVIIAAALVSGCGVAGQPDAATVGSEGISRAAFEDDLDALLGNQKFIAFLESADSSLDIQPVSAGINPAISTQWLNLLVNQSIIDQAFEARGLEVTDENRQAAQAGAEEIFGGAEVFAAFPRWFREENLERQARTEALTADVPPNPPPTQAQLQQYFDSVLASQCTSNLVIQDIQVATQAEAAVIEQQLAQGADFATVARERSTDAGSAAQDGVLWCTESQEFAQQEATFRDAVLAAIAGQDPGPVQTATGWHVIRVVPWTLENIRPLVVQQYATQQDSPLAGLLNERLQRTKVWVDPRYGTVDRTGQFVVIQQPRVPSPQVRPTTDELSPNP
jgi:parvulin-like peptidyl-prolyl isomerase